MKAKYAQLRRPLNPFVRSHTIRNDFVSKIEYSDTAWHLWNIWLVPWLKDMEFEDAEPVADREALETDDSGDPAAAWLSNDEWKKLPSVERYQRALDRYKCRPKSDWEVGRDFERFVGFQLETQGYRVIYHGAIKGFDDFGRDPIATDWTGKVLLIQCKRWSKRKVIPEAVLFQLFGSAVSKRGKSPGSASFLLAPIRWRGLFGGCAAARPFRAKPSGA